MVCTASPCIHLLRLALVSDAQHVAAAHYARNSHAFLLSRVPIHSACDPDCPLQTSTGVVQKCALFAGYPHDNKNDGVYTCALGGLPLFDSKTKFDSGTGWPSFYAPIDPQHVIEIKDTSIPFMTRVEVVDARSGAHLGHVFNDGMCSVSGNNVLVHNPHLSICCCANVSGRLAHTSCGATYLMICKVSRGHTQNVFKHEHVR